MLFPKKVKYRKWQTGRRNPAKIRFDSRGTSLAFGAFGLKALGAARISSAQIEASRRVVSRSLAKGGKMWIRIFPDRPYTAKAAEVGMGKGKGDPKGYVFQVLPGRILFEVEGAAPDVARNALRKAGFKLPLKTKVVERSE